MNKRNNNFSHLPFFLSVYVFSLLASPVVLAASISTVDWDNDGISDENEALLGSLPYLSDTDGDGVSDLKELGSITEPRDTDKDGIIDILDIDDDGDGIPSVIEGFADSDKDGKVNYLDTDSDGDGLDDGLEVRLTGKDSDGDQLDDLFDVDITKGQDENGDGIDDNIAMVDSNKDGIPDLLDKKSKRPHLKTRTHNAKIIAHKNAEKLQSEEAVKITKKPIVVSALKLPDMAKTPKRREHTYVEKKENRLTDSAGSYGGSGYFYCGNTGQIVKGIKGFKMTPPNKVTLLRDASEGFYEWRAEEPGTYALQFQIPTGMSIVRGLAKGRRIVKQGDTNPLVLGGHENTYKKGYLLKSSGQSNNWYTSFEFKDGAPLAINNNIPLSGGICNQ